MYDLKYSLPTDGAEASAAANRTSRGVSGALYLQPATLRIDPSRNCVVLSAPGKQR